MGRRDTVISCSGVSLGPERWTAVLSGGRGHGCACGSATWATVQSCLCATGCRLQAAGCREAGRPRADFPSDPSVHGQSSPPGGWGPNLCYSGTPDMNAAD